MITGATEVRRIGFEITFLNGQTFTGEFSLDWEQALEWYREGGNPDCSRVNETYVVETIFYYADVPWRDEICKLLGLDLDSYLRNLLYSVTPLDPFAEYWTIRGWEIKAQDD